MPRVFCPIFPSVQAGRESSRRQPLPGPLPGNSTNVATQGATNSVGALGDVRYDFGRHSAFDLSFTFNRDSVYLSRTCPVSQRVQTNNFEVIGSYIFRLPAKSI